MEKELWMLNFLWNLEEHWTTAVCKGKKSTKKHDAYFHIYVVRGLRFYYFKDFQKFNLRKTAYLPLRLQLSTSALSVLHSAFCRPIIFALDIVQSMQHLEDRKKRNCEANTVWWKTGAPFSDMRVTITSVTFTQSMKCGQFWTFLSLDVQLCSLFPLWSEQFCVVQQGGGGRMGLIPALENIVYSEPCLLPTGRMLLNCIDEAPAVALIARGLVWIQTH